MSVSRAIIPAKGVDSWNVGDLIPFRWDRPDGEFGGYLKVVARKEDGTFAMKFVPPWKNENQGERHGS